MILVRMGFVPYFLFRKIQLFVNLRFITWNNLVEMFWLFLDVFNFLLLEMNRWICKECAWVKAFLVTLRPGYLKIIASLILPLKNIQFQV